MVDSSATTGRPAASAAATAPETLIASRPRAVPPAGAAPAVVLVMVSALLTSQIITQVPGRSGLGRGGRRAKGAAAKSGQNKSINDAGWGIFLRVLSVKAERAGRRVSAVDPRHTSQRCAECGHAAAGNRVSQLAFRCLIRGHQANEDVNAARNILRAGLALQEAQDAV
jgi:hypothetical protein